MYDGNNRLKNQHYKFVTQARSDIEVFIDPCIAEATIIRLVLVTVVRHSLIVLGLLRITSS